VYDQFGEEGLKGGGAPPPGAGGFSGFGGAPGGGFPGGTTFSFSSSGGPGGGFAPSDPNFIFEQFLKNMGGFGGGRGGFGRNAFMDDEEHTPGGSPFAGGPGGMPGGFGGGIFSGGMPHAHAQPGTSRKRPGSPNGAAAANRLPDEYTRPIRLSLEDLFNGTTKRLRIGRKLEDGQTEDKTVEIHVLPGWKSGTKVRFKAAGNERTDGTAQDVVFIVEELPHSRFTRSGDDLIYHAPLPLLEALAGNGGTTSVEGIDGKRIQLSIPKSVVRPGQESRVTGEGMPIRKDGASGKRRGDLIVKWDIKFPDRLTDSQKEGLRKVLG